MKEKDKVTEINCNEIEISNLLDKEFKIMVIKVVTKFRRTI